MKEHSIQTRNRQQELRMLQIPYHGAAVMTWDMYLHSQGEASKPVLAIVSVRHSKALSCSKHGSTVSSDERVAAAALGSLANIAACKAEPEEQPAVKQVPYGLSVVLCSLVMFAAQPGCTYRAGLDTEGSQMLSCV